MAGKAATLTSPTRFRIQRRPSSEKHRRSPQPWSAPISRANSFASAAMVFARACPRSGDAAWFPAVAPRVASAFRL